MFLRVWFSGRPYPNPIKPTNKHKKTGGGWLALPSMIFQARAHEQKTPCESFLVLLIRSRLIFSSEPPSWNQIVCTHWNMHVSLHVWEARQNAHRKSSTKGDSCPLCGSDRTPPSFVHRSDRFLSGRLFGGFERWSYFYRFLGRAFSEIWIGFINMWVLNTEESTWRCVEGAWTKLSFLDVENCANLS